MPGNEVRGCYNSLYATPATRAHRATSVLGYKADYFESSSIARFEEKNVKFMAQDELLQLRILTCQFTF